MLEDIYNIPEAQILHIHGSTLLGSRSLIFRHDVALEEIPAFDKNGEPTRTPFSASEALSKYPFTAFQKPVTEILKENDHFLTSLDQIDKVVILGHSLGAVDLPYFKKISTQLPDTSWEVGYYSKRDKSSRLSIVKGILQDNERIKMFRF